MKGYARLLLAISCVVISIAALINVFADNDDVLAQAKAVACPKSCDVASMQRTPFAQTFALRAAGVSVTVRCTRSAIFFGDYACAKP